MEESTFLPVSSSNPEEINNANYEKFANPKHYHLNQSFFSMEELTNQPNFNIICQPNFMYFGGIYKNMKHGLGVFLTEDTVYEGQFSLDFKSGKGYQKFPNGSVYVGDFQNNRTHG